MCSLPLYAGLPFAFSCAQARADSTGEPACEVCGRRLRTVKHHRPHGVGRACHPHCKGATTPSTLAAVAPLLASPPVPTTHPSVDAASPRSKRPYEQLHSTQQWKRRKAAHQALNEIGCPIEALHSHPSVTAANVIHLSTAERERIRSVQGLRIPSEQTIASCKKALATTHATETSTFANGAFITDPIRFVSCLCVQSSVLAVGGDAGGGLTKLGVTYMDQNNNQSFAALLVYDGKDTYDDLSELQQADLTPFSGQSASFPHIFAVLQHLIDTHTHRAFLNGDWPFINTVLGLKNACATHPCPICTIASSNLLGSAQYRKPKDRQSRNRQHAQLLLIDPERIVPTPLHLFLGIGNRIIMDAFTELLGSDAVETALKHVRTIHSAGCGGLADQHQLNGPEIAKWIKQKGIDTAVEAASSSAYLPSRIKSTLSVLSRWLTLLHAHLLHQRDWQRKDIEEWRAAVDDIQKHWTAEAATAPFPKLHMLRHSLEFAERHRFLGRVSEAQIESYHAQFNSLYHKQHRNMSHDTPQRIRRAVADATLRAIQPVVQQPISTPC